MKLERIQLAIDYFEKKLASVDSNLILARLELSMKREEKLKKAQDQFDIQKAKYSKLEDYERHMKMSRAERDFQYKVEEIEDDYKYGLESKESSAKSSKFYFQSHLKYQEDKYEAALKRQRQRITGEQTDKEDK